MMSQTELDIQSIQTIRFLAADIVQQAGSGHPGTPMGAAAIAYTLWERFLNDSIGLGEDGPTHQPVEHLLALRAIPNLTVIRPADATETAEAWRAALLNQNGPTALILSRQNLAVLDRKSLAPTTGGLRGGYVLWELQSAPELILIGAGSEVQVALESGKKLDEAGTPTGAVSLPSWELFDQQPAEYHEAVLPSRVRAPIAVEAAGKLGWERYVGLDGAVIGLDDYGASAPAETLYEKFGIITQPDGLNI